MWSVKCKVWSGEWGEQSIKCGVWIVKCGMCGMCGMCGVCGV